MLSRSLGARLVLTDSCPKEPHGTHISKQADQQKLVTFPFLPCQTVNISVNSIAANSRDNPASTVPSDMCHQLHSARRAPTATGQFFLANLSSIQTCQNSLLSNLSTNMLSTSAPPAFIHLPGIIPVLIPRPVPVPAPVPVQVRPDRRAQSDQLNDAQSSTCQACVRLFCCL